MTSWRKYENKLPNRYKERMKLELAIFKTCYFTREKQSNMLIHKYRDESSKIKLNLPKTN